MNDDRQWDNIVDAIDARFGIKDHGRRSETLEDNQELTQKIAFIVFEKDGKTFKLERVTRPAVADRKSFYHKAATGGIRFENIYDPESLVHKTYLYSLDGDDWQEIDPSQLSL